MENPEEVLRSLEEFSKFRPKDIPRELEEYLCFVAKTGDPVYQWSAIKSLFREKLISVVTEFSEACPSVEIPPCPNVELFNYDTMKGFILERLDTFAAAPFTIQRICELLTTPRKEYNRIDKYMRALEKNILVVSTTEPGRRSTENGEGILNGLESEHVPEASNSSNDINVEEMDDAPAWPKEVTNVTFLQSSEPDLSSEIQETFISESKITESEIACSSSQDTVITCRTVEQPYVSIEPVPTNSCVPQEDMEESNTSVTITPVPAGVQNRRNSVEPVVSTDTVESTSVPSEEEKEVTAPADVKPKIEEIITSDLPKTADSTTVSQTNSEDNIITPSDDVTSDLKDEGVITECLVTESVIIESGNVATSSNASFSLNIPNEINEESTEADPIVTPETHKELEHEAEYVKDCDEAVTTADTTKDDEFKTETSISKNIEEEDKDEEISSSDKVLVSIVTNSEDTTSGDEAEAKAQEETTVSSVPSSDSPPQEIVNTEAEAEVSATTEIDNDAVVVSASTDELLPDIERETPMDVDTVDEKDDINEAEATSCESG